MSKPVINVTRSSMPSFEEYCAEIRPLWESHFLTNMGEKHLQLEADLKRYLGAPNVTLFTNGHLALENILTAMDLHGEIITTPFTFANYLGLLQGELCPREWKRPRLHSQAVV